MKRLAMSRQLAISSAFSVLMMASFVLFSSNTTRASLDSDGATGLPGIGASILLPR